MWTNGPWEWFPFMWIFPLICIVAMMFFFGRMGPWSGGRAQGGGDSSAKEILSRRYARGEITKDEYQRMRGEID